MKPTKLTKNNTKILTNIYIFYVTLLCLTILPHKRHLVNCLKVEPKIYEFENVPLGQYQGQRIIISNDNPAIQSKIQIAELLKNNQELIEKLDFKMESITLSQLRHRSQGKNGETQGVRKTQTSKSSNSTEPTRPVDSLAVCKENCEDEIKGQTLELTNSKKEDTFQTLIRLNPIRAVRKSDILKDPNQVGQILTDSPPGTVTDLNSIEPDISFRTSFDLESGTNILTPGESAYLDMRFIPTRLDSYYDQDFLISWQESIIKRSPDGLNTVFKNYGDISYTTIKIKAKSVYNDLLPGYLYDYFYPHVDLSSIMPFNSETLPPNELEELDEILAGTNMQAKDFKRPKTIPANNRPAKHHVAYNTVHYNTTFTFPIILNNVNDNKIEITDISSSDLSLQLEWSATNQEIRRNAKEQKKERQDILEQSEDVIRNEDHVKYYPMSCSAWEIPGNSHKIISTVNWRRSCEFILPAKKSSKEPPRISKKLQI